MQPSGRSVVFRIPGPKAVKYAVGEDRRVWGFGALQTLTAIVPVFLDVLG